MTLINHLCSLPPASLAIVSSISITQGFPSATATIHLSGFDRPKYHDVTHDLEIIARPKGPRPIDDEPSIKCMEYSGHDDIIIQIPADVPSQIREIMSSKIIGTAEAICQKPVKGGATTWRIVGRGGPRSIERKQWIREVL